MMLYVDGKQRRYHSTLLGTRSPAHCVNDSYIIAGRRDIFVLAAAVYAVGTAIIGASPAAYAADVMPKDAAGLGLGIYRCAGDLGACFK